MEKLILTITFVIGFSCTYADIWTVNPDGTADCNDIQAAINRAQNGDVVLLEDGLYTGDGNRNISFLGKAITVKSRNGPDNCIIDGTTDAPVYRRGFIFESGETRLSVLEGVTIRNFWLLTCCPGGAGIYIEDGSPTVRNCNIIHCRVDLDYCPCITYGGGISVEQGSPLFEGCIIKENSICDFGYGGGIACSTDSSGGNVFVFLRNCVIVQNEGTGGGIYMHHYLDAWIENCTIADNQDYGLWCDYFEMSSYPTQVRECIFRGNYPEQTWGYNLQISLNYTPNLGPTTRPEPKFVDPANGDYHLQWDSPCIDFCQYGQYDPKDVDMDGEPRVMGLYADAGADEVGPKQADFSRNGRIDFEDFAVLSAAWQTIPENLNWYVLCDLHPDDSIDLYDLEIVADDWLWRASWFETE